MALFDPRQVPTTDNTDSTSTTSGTRDVFNQAPEAKSELYKLILALMLSQGGRAGQTFGQYRSSGPRPFLAPGGVSALASAMEAISRPGAFDSRQTINDTSRTTSSGVRRGTQLGTSPFQDYSTAAATALAALPRILQAGSSLADIYDRWSGGSDPTAAIPGVPTSYQDGYPMSPYEGYDINNPYGMTPVDGYGDSASQAAGDPFSGGPDPEASWFATNVLPYISQLWN